MNYRQQKIESTSWLLKEALAGYDVAATAPDADRTGTGDLGLMCEDLIRQFREILELDSRHHFLSVTMDDYDFPSGEAKIDQYLDDFIESAGRALTLCESAPLTPEGSREIVEHLAGCVEEARLCRNPNQDYADREEVQAALARSEEDIRAGRVERF